MSEPMWFYWSKSSQVGPFSRKELISMHLKGIVSGATLVSKEHSNYWLPLEKALQIRQVPVAPVYREGELAESHWYRHSGSTVCLILGAVFFILGLSHLSKETEIGEGAFVAGPLMILGATAYRSAKKRRLKERISTVARKLVEIALLLLICVLVLTQNNLKYQMTTHPAPNLIVPLWAIVAYLAVNLMPVRKFTSEASGRRDFSQDFRAYVEQGTTSFVRQLKKRYKKLF